MTDMMASTSQEAQQIKILKENLQKLNCPYVIDVDDQWIRDMLFQTSDTRLQFFHWLLDKICPKLSNVKHGQAFNSQIIYSKLQNTLYDLGCTVDSAVIQGTASVKEQLSLLNFLIKVLLYAEHMIPLELNSSNLSAASNCSMLMHNFCGNVNQQCHNSNNMCHKFLNAVADHDQSCNLSTYLPCDILTLYKKLQTAKCTRTVIGPLSNLKNLWRFTEALDSEIQQVQVNVNELPCSTLCPTEIDKLKETSQRVDKYISLYVNMYINEMQAFCRWPKKFFHSELGSSCDAVLRNIEEFSVVCDNISAFHDFKSAVMMHKLLLDELKANNLSEVQDCCEQDYKGNLLKYSIILKHSINRFKEKPLITNENA